MPRARCLPSLVSILVAAGALAGPVRHPPAGRAPLPPSGQGISVRLGDPEAAAILAAAGGGSRPDDPLFVRVVAPRPRVQRDATGRYDFAGLDALVARGREGGWRLILCLTGHQGPSGPEDPGARPELPEGWLGFVRAAVERYRERVDLFQVWEAPDRRAGWGREPSARDYAFLFKSTAVTIRSVLPTANVGLGDMGADSAAFLDALYDHGVGPYADAVAVDGRPGDISDSALEAIRRVVAERDPASPLWFSRVPVRDGARAELLGEFASGAGRGAGLVLFEPQSPGAVANLRVLHDRFHAGVAPLPGEDATFLVGDAGPVPVEAYAFLDAGSLQVLLVYRPLGPTEPGTTAEVLLGTAEARELRLVDLASGSEESVGLYIPDPSAGTTRADVPLGPGGRLLVYRRFADAALRADSEAIQVTGAAEVTVEEILAAHQAFRAAGQDKLRAYTAHAQMDLHFQIGAGRSLDVTYLQEFFYERGKGPEWEMRELLVNGVRWRGKRVPRLPFVQPDKVVILPLDIHLDRRYRYRLAGTDEVDGYPTWRIVFEPDDPDAALYRGTVWIEKRTFARVKMSVRQRGLAPPFLSNDEVNHYRPVLGPDGTEHWVLTRIDGSQLYTISGRSFVVNREVQFSGVRINPDDFHARQQEAYRSERPILRDTDDGFRYLRRTADGHRELEEMPRDQLFWLGGVFYNEATDFPVPLAGVNYFNFDVAGSGAQINLFFAGALLFFNATDPDVLGSPLELGADAFGQAFDLTDRLLVEGEELEAGNVDRKSQLVRPFLAASLGGFWKLRASYELAWQNFSRDEETAPGFVIPTDTLVHTVGLGLNYNRRAWSFAAAASASRRDDWEPWGIPEQQATFDPETREYYTWSATLAKEIYLPHFQKLRFQADWSAGEDLDRFSRFQFGFFSDRRLRGFSGSGLRFDRGGILRAQYAFNFFDKVRFAVGVDHARVREAEDDPGSHTGLGLSGSFMGPWGTILSFDWGIAVSSDVPAVEGEQEFQFFFLKLF